MAASDSVIRRIAEAVDLVEYVGRSVTLKKSGRLHSACCPFHQEKTPSFYVSADKQRWYCYGSCATSGDIFSYLEKRDGLGFREALEMLSDMVNIPLDDESESERDKYKQSYAALAEAAAYYQSVLTDHPEAEAARQYLAERELIPDTLSAFQIGYARSGWRACKEYLNEKGFHDEVLLVAGILSKKDENSRPYDALRDRIVFPIRDERGRVIGFGGRVLPNSGSKAKYLNTAETALFKKHRTVYGIDLARRSIGQAGTAVLVEGYMDVIASHQAGQRNVVACMGTSVTESQVQRLWRHAKALTLCMDGDDAGRNSAKKSIVNLLEVSRAAQTRGKNKKSSLDLSVAVMPKGHDPDSLIRQDAAAWAERIESPQPAVQFYIDALVADAGGSESAPQKKSIVADAIVVIRLLADPVERAHYEAALAKAVDMSKDVIEARVSHDISGSKAPVITPPSSQAQINQAIEVDLLGLLVSAPNVFYQVCSHLQELDLPNVNESDFQMVEAKEIIKTFRLMAASTDEFQILDLQEALPAALQAHLSDAVAAGVVQLPNDGNISTVARDAACTLLLSRIARVSTRMDEVIFLATYATGSNQPEVLVELLNSATDLDMEKERLIRAKETL